MKKISFLLLALVCAVNLMAETVLIDGLYYSIGTTTVSVVADQTSGKSVYGSYIDVTIPASVYYNNYTYPVTTIGTSAFEYCTNLQSVTLPNSITAIYTDAFYGCTKLGDINELIILLATHISSFLHGIIVMFFKSIFRYIL